MSGFLNGPASRRRFAFLGHLCFVGLAGVALPNCSGGGAAGSGADQIKVETSAFSVAVQNVVGMPLVDVEVAIVPVGGITRFTKFAGRIENGERRELQLNTFMDSGGTPFSLRLVRPKTVRVTGKDLNSKVVEIEVPWN